MRWSFLRWPVDDSLPNGIAAAIDILCRDPSDANRTALYRALSEGDLFLVVAGSMAAPAELRQDATLPVLTTTSPNGKPALVAFTSLAQLKRRMPDTPGYARVTSLKALGIVLDQELDGLVLDPDGPWAAVPREDIARIRNQEWHAV